MSKRVPKGIFGLPRPSKNMLFSFTPRAGDEWPEEQDDDDDSDYEPGDSLKPMVEDIPRDSDSEESDEPSTSSQRKRKSKSPATASRRETKKAKVDSSVKSKKSKKKKRHEEEKKDGKKKHKNSSNSSTTRRGGSSSLVKNTAVPKKRQGDVDIFAVTAATSSDGDDMWGQRLPLVALERILFFAVRQVGVVPLLCRVSRLCRLWRDAARSITLWRHVNLDNGRIKATDVTLEWLLANRFSSQLLTINVNSWTKLTDRSFVTLAEASPNLENISVQRCSKLSSRSIYAIKDNCQHLKKIDLGFTGNSLVSSPSLRDLLKERGATIEELHLTGCAITSSVQLLSSIKSFCPSLRLLDLSNCQVTVECLMLPVEALQKGCPLLEILRVAGSKVQAASASAKAKAESEGFPHLQELSVAVADDVAWQVCLPANLGVNNEFIQRVLRKSTDLRLLDLRGCALINLKTLQELPVENLEQLYISRCSLSKHEGLDIIVSKWSHSLAELDLSWNTFPGSSLDSAMRKLSSSSQLKRLDLSGTNVSVASVKLILNGCRHLESIKLSSCRALPRGTKRAYEGKSIRELRKELGSSH